MKMHQTDITASQAGLIAARLSASISEIAGNPPVVARCEARPSLCQLDPTEFFSC